MNHSNSAHGGLSMELGWSPVHSYSPNPPDADKASKSLSYSGRELKTAASDEKQEGMTIHRESKDLLAIYRSSSNAADYETYLAVSFLRNSA